jgi:hypothetical protein
LLFSSAPQPLRIPLEGRLKHKALTYQSSRNVSVQTAPDPVLEQEYDVVLRVTATPSAALTSTSSAARFQKRSLGTPSGTEFMGVVEEAG